MWTIVIFSSMGSGVVKSLICKWGIEFGWEGVGVGTTVPYLGVLILTGFSLLFWYLTRVYKVPQHTYILWIDKESFYNDFTKRRPIFIRLSFYNTGVLFVKSYFKKDSLSIHEIRWVHSMMITFAV